MFWKIDLLGMIEIKSLLRASLTLSARRGKEQLEMCVAVSSIADPDSSPRIQIHVRQLLARSKSD